MKKSEAKKPLNEEELRDLVANIPGMVYIGKPDWSAEIISHSKGICGYTPKELNTEVRWSEIIHPEDKKRVVEEAAGAEKGPMRLVQTYRIIAKDGKVRWVEDRKRSFFSDGRFGGVRGVAFDITKRKLVEDALRESEERFRLIVENSRDAIMITLPDKTVSYMSPACRKVLGHGPEELVGTVPDIFHPDDRGRVLKRLSEAVKGKSGSDFEYRIITKDGKTKWVSHSWAPAMKGREVRFIVSTVRDITQRKKAEEERLEFYKTKELGEMKDEFFSMTAHELKTPLTPIKLESDMWLRGMYGELSEKQEESVKRMSRNAGRLISLIEDISIINKMDQKRLRYRFRTVDLNQVLRDLGSDMKAQVEEEGLYLKVRPGPEPLKARADRGRISQVLSNLVDNAMRATKEGGITVTASKKGNSALVSVKDTGRGIPKEDREAIFDMFYRVEHPTAERYEGTGLGLTIAKRIIERHGGRIWCECVRGKGSTFYFTLPLK